MPVDFSGGVPRQLPYRVHSPTFSPTSSPPPSAPHTIEVVPAPSCLSRVATVATYVATVATYVATTEKEARSHWPYAVFSTLATAVKLTVGLVGAPTTTEYVLETIANAVVPYLGISGSSNLMRLATHLCCDNKDTAERIATFTTQLGLTAVQAYFNPLHLIPTVLVPLARLANERFGNEWTQAHSAFIASAFYTVLDTVPLGIELAKAVQGQNPIRQRARFGPAEPLTMSANAYGWPKNRCNMSADQVSRESDGSFRLTISSGPDTCIGAEIGATPRGPYGEFCHSIRLPETTPPVGTIVGAGFEISTWSAQDWNHQEGDNGEVGLLNRFTEWAIGRFDQGVKVFEKLIPITQIGDLTQWHRFCTQYSPTGVIYFADGQEIGEDTHVVPPLPLESRANVWAPTYFKEPSQNKNWSWWAGNFTFALPDSPA